MDQKSKFKLLYLGIFLSLMSWIVEIVFAKYMIMSEGIWFILNILLFLAAVCIMTAAYFNIRKKDKSFMTAFVFGIITIAAVIAKLIGLMTKTEGLVSTADLILGIGSSFAPYFAIDGIRKTIEQGHNERSLTIIESGKAVQWCFSVMNVLFLIAPVMAALTWLFKLDLTTPTSVLNDFTQCLSLIGYGVFTHFVWECTFIDEDLNI